MKEIPLSNGGVALVDDEDYEFVSRWSWRRDRKGYAHRMVYVGYKNGKAKLRGLKMHRLIMGEVPGVQYDHINGDKCDNRRSNLRVATNQQNTWNSPKMSDMNSSAIAMCFVGILVLVQQVRRHFRVYKSLRKR